MNAKVKTMEPAFWYQPPAHCPRKLGSVSVLEDITANQSLIIVISGAFELIYNANNEEKWNFKSGTIYYGHKQELLVNLELSYRL